MKTLHRPLFVLLFVALAVSATAQTATRVYWTEWRSYNPTLSRIARAHIDGSNVESLVTGFHDGTGVKDLAIDSGAGKLYWANRPAGLIERANLDGTDRQTVIDDVHPIGLALDVGGGRIYWTDYTYDNPRIRRANLDGTGVEDLVAASTGCQLEGIVLDLDAGHLYWAERLDQQIWRSNLDGSGATLILQCWAGIGHPWGLALHGGRLYWSSGHAIISATTQGTDVQALVSDLPDTPRSLEIDAAASRLYWVTGDMWSAMVQCIDLDGTGLQTLVSGLSYGYGLALEYGAAVSVAEPMLAASHLDVFPNPFNPSTLISFDLATAQALQLRVHAVDGTLLRTLLDGRCDAGHYAVRWDGCDGRQQPLPSGVYLGVLSSDQQRRTVRMTLIR